MQYPTVNSIDYKKELNEEQYNVVSSNDRHCLILAGAGSGKTRTLTYRVAWLLEHGVSPHQILLLTFTNKASKEMLGRVEELTGISQREFWGGTFHSIGQRILRFNSEKLGLEKNYTILDADDSKLLFKNICKKEHSELFKLKDFPKPDIIFSLISYSRNTQTPLAEVIERRAYWIKNHLSEILHLANTYSTDKKKQQVCDFDDLLELFAQLLKENPDIKEYYGRRFKHILVDEFQDTNTIQSEIVHLLGSETNSIMAVGDDAQCIYTWRGANYENITNFIKKYPDVSIHKIETNYRSSPEILNFANSILSECEDELNLRKILRSTRSQGKKPYLIPAITMNDQAKIVLGRIENIVQVENRSYKDIAVLYRSHFHAKELQMELNRHHIPYNINSGVQFFQQAHIRDFVAQIKIVLNDNDTTAFIRLLCLLEKVGAQTALKIHTLAKEIAEKKSIPFVFALLEDKIKKKIPAIAMDDFIDLSLTLQNIHEGVYGKFTPASQNEEENSLFSFAEKKENEKQPEIIATPATIIEMAIEGWYGDHLKKCYENWEDREEDLKSLISFAENYDSITTLVEELVLLGSEDVEKNNDSGEEKINLTTIHQAKGLEFPIVFILDCADELFPTKRSIEEEDISEERRLFYVAATRAKDELYMLYPQMNAGFSGSTMFYNPSRFIREADPNTFEKVNVRIKHY